ncbi:MAG: 2-oxoacid:acceptor oxidoreductase family protein [Bilophila sp.]
MARTTTYHMREMIPIFKKALEHEGFAVIEVMTQCPTYFGRRNKLGDAAEMMRGYRDRTAPVGSPTRRRPHAGAARHLHRCEPSRILRPLRLSNRPRARGVSHGQRLCRFWLSPSGSGGRGNHAGHPAGRGRGEIRGLVAVQSQSYGPEARGGATRSDVILRTRPSDHPKVEQPNILVALTDAACAKYLPLIRPGGLCLYDADSSHPGRRVEARLKGLPLSNAVRDRLGSAVSYNIAVLGALVATDRSGTDCVRGARPLGAFSGGAGKPTCGPCASAWTWPSRCSTDARRGHALASCAASPEGASFLPCRPGAIRCPGGR